MTTKYIVVLDDREERSITDSVYPLGTYDTKAEAEKAIIAYEEECSGPIEEQFDVPAHWGWLNDRLSPEDRARLSPEEKEDYEHGNDIYAVFIEDSPNDPYPEFERFYRLWRIEV